VVTCSTAKRLESSLNLAVVVADLPNKEIEYNKMTNIKLSLLGITNYYLFVD
jgi:hypothetical protein